MAKKRRTTEPADALWELQFAVDLQEDYVTEAANTLKEAKALQQRLKRRLARAEADYTKHTGKPVPKFKL